MSAARWEPELDPDGAECRALSAARQLLEELLAFGRGEIQHLPFGLMSRLRHLPEPERAILARAVIREIVGFDEVDS